MKTIGVKMKISIRNLKRDKKQIKWMLIQLMHIIKTFHLLTIQIKSKKIKSILQIKEINQMIQWIEILKINLKI